MIQTKAKLESWAAWVKSNPERLGWPNHSISVPYKQMYAYEHEKKAEFISDEEAMQIDRLLKILEKRNERAFMAVTTHYMSGQSIVRTVDIVNGMRKRKQKITGLVYPELKRTPVADDIRKGEVWIDGALCVIV